jgi:hypothetical protein
MIKFEVLKPAYGLSLACKSVNAVYSETCE